MTGEVLPNGGRLQGGPSKYAGEGFPAFAEFVGQGEDLEAALECVWMQPAIGGQGRLRTRFLVELVRQVEVEPFSVLKPCDELALLTAVDSRTNPASTAGTAQHDLDLVSG